jgi:hypothetical protein
MLGNLAARAAALSHAEADVLYPVTAQPNGRPTPGSADVRALRSRILTRWPACRKQWRRSSTRPAVRMRAALNANYLLGHQVI